MKKLIRQFKHETIIRTDKHKLASIRYKPKSRTDKIKIAKPFLIDDKEHYIVGGVYYGTRDAFVISLYFTWAKIC